MKNSKKIGAFIAGVLAVAMVAGSWAFFSMSSSIENELSTNSYKGSTIEEFTPDQKMEPGETIKKTASVTNTGSYDLVVRIKMSEKWSRDGAEFIAFTSDQVQFRNASRTGSDPNYEYHAVQRNDGDGLTAGDSSVVYKEMDLTDWVLGNDGYWYYKKRLEPGQTTGDLLKSVTLADNTDMGAYNALEYYSTANKDTVNAAKTTYEAAMASATTQEQRDAAEAAMSAVYNWQLIPASGIPASVDQSTINYKKSESVIDDAAKGYADADYTLTIVTDICQATKDAVSELWGTTEIPPTGANWALN